MQDQETEEREELSFNVIASDPDDEDELTLEASSDNLPDGWEFTDNEDGSGDFVWIPGHNDHGTYTVIFTVYDGELRVDAEVRITVGNVNFPPEWDDDIQDQETDEREELSFRVTASDPDEEDELTLEASSDNLPDGWEFTDNENKTGDFGWTPGYNDHGTYTVIFTVSDSEFDVAAEVTITVNDVNFSPQWDDIPETIIRTAEQEELSFSVTASDPDDEDELTLDAYSDDLPDGWDFTDNDDGSGDFVWTPGYNDEGSYTLILTVSDEEFDVDAEVRITVGGENFPPEWDDIPESRVTNEGNELSFRITASDPDGDRITLDASTEDRELSDLLDDLFTDNGDGTGDFEWTPGGNDHGSYTVIFTVYDGEFNVDAEVTITVNNINFRPLWENIPDQETNEDQALSFRITASDPDDEDEITLEASSNVLPEGWRFTDNDDGTGDFIWTPGYEDNGRYNVVFRVSDGDRYLDEEVTITVHNVNRAPDIGNIGNRTIGETNQLTIDLSVTDQDEHDEHEFDMEHNLPGDPSLVDGQFTWRPDWNHARGDADYWVTFRVTDNDADGEGRNPLSDEQRISITVNNRNRGPTLEHIGEQEIDEVSSLSITPQANDPDEDDILSFSIANSPDGASWNGTIFRWTPNYEQAGEYRVTFTVRDNDAGFGNTNLEHSETITITVNNTNRPPNFQAIENQGINENQQLNIDLSATDDDSDELTFSIQDHNLPGNPIISNNNRFEWMPDYNAADPNADYTVTLRVTDNDADGNGENPQHDDESFNVTVNNNNRPPELDEIGEQETDENSRLTIVLEASDSDEEDELTYSVQNNPDGSSLNGSTFIWTPTHQQAGEYNVTFIVTDDDAGFRENNLDDSETITITVNNINHPPELDEIGDQDTNENSRLTIVLEASDPDEDELTYSVQNNPDGSSLNGSTFTWTPTYQQAGEYNVTFIVTDDDAGFGDNYLNDSETITITVNNTNRRPSLNIHNQQVNESVQLSVNLNNYAADADDDELTYEIVNETLPREPVLNNGILTWTPTYDDAGNYSVTIRVTDDGTPENLSAEDSFSITVNNTNRRPTLSIPDQRVNENVQLSVNLNNYAADADDDELTYEIVTETLPREPVLNNGILTWTPTYDDAGNYSVTIRVTDDGTPENLSAEDSFSITVNNINRRPTLSIPDQRVNENVQLSVNLNNYASDADDDELTYEIVSETLPREPVLNNGILTWTPTYDDAGNYSVTIMVTDDGTPENLSAEDSFSITVNNINRRPTLSIPDQRVNENVQLSVNLNNYAADADDDELIYEIINETLPREPVLNNGILTWTPTYDDAGNYSVTIRTTDDGTPENLSAEDSFSITVNNINRRPTLNIPNRHVNENVQLSINLNDYTTDADDDELTYEIVSETLPREPVLENDILTWTPNYNDAGNYSVTIRVTDNGTPENLSAEDSFNVTVRNVNRPPQWDEIPDRVETDENVELSFSVSYSDPDVDDVTLEASSDDLPDGWRFTDNEDGTADFIWTPGYDDSGDYSITFVASDGNLEIEGNVEIVVNNVNRAPIWDEIEQQTVIVEERLRVDLWTFADDPDGDNLTYTIIRSDLPDDNNARISFGRYFQWTPANDDAGDYQVTIRATDDGDPERHSDVAFAITVQIP
ncbi:MAG: Ig-like domain-containing protein [Candidatus Hatepunaea meridiana]|nr:Ig-like domain-containing protein [Candidatus Hatepunaea meridiana]